MSEMVQHVLATIVALAAAVYLWRRVFAMFRPTRGAGKCASCPSGRAPARDEGGTAPLKMIR